VCGDCQRLDRPARTPPNGIQAVAIRMPQSMVSVVPVIARASSDARKAQALATSVASASL
jgi:hypothetical protein